MLEAVLPVTNWVSCRKRSRAADGEREIYLAVDLDQPHRVVASNNLLHVGLISTHVRVAFHRVMLDDLTHTGRDGAMLPAEGARAHISRPEDVWGIDVGMRASTNQAASCSTAGAARECTSWPSNGEGSLRPTHRLVLVVVSPGLQDGGARASLTMGSDTSTSQDALDVDEVGGLGLCMLPQLVGLDVHLDQHAGDGLVCGMGARAIMPRLGWCSSR